VEAPELFDFQKAIGTVDARGLALVGICLAIPEARFAAQMSWQECLPRDPFLGAIGYHDPPPGAGAFQQLIEERRRIGVRGNVKGQGLGELLKVLVLAAWQEGLNFGE
jgi:hypothetical protein